MSIAMFVWTFGDFVDAIVLAAVAILFAVFVVVMLFFKAWEYLENRSNRKRAKKGGRR
ncbi:MAG: hypothetical protein GXY15_01850 [Candidatus Hydrogenedentes bacterium]|nr:hypothetical protein [Candidatus Hydrogenedentota bacterium]